MVETAFPRIKIRGELSQITRATSGHMYMTIKDSGAAISVIIWRGTPINFKLEEGMEVVVTGKFTTYPARSNYQIIVNEVEIKQLPGYKNDEQMLKSFNGRLIIPVCAYPCVIYDISLETIASLSIVLTLRVYLTVFPAASSA